MCFFFSSRRRHTRCALVTGVQTCALPISRHDNRLAVSATPSMASAWLVPRLGGFLAAHPQVEISLQSTESVVDFSREPQNVAALRIGLGQWPGVVSEHLFGEWLVAMRSEERRVGKEGGSTCRSRWATCQ